MKLVEYGIQTEKSDYRIHVCFKTTAVYFFKTAEAVRWLEANSQRYKLTKAYQPGVSSHTALGYLVPPFDIPGCRLIGFPLDRLHVVNCQRSDSPSIKGQKAVAISQTLFERGIVPIPMKVTLVDAKNEQIKGIDVMAHTSINVQVKCDFDGGEGLWASGYLYLQTAERNPLGRH